MTEPGRPTPLVDVRGLAKTFPDGTRALAGVDFRIARPGVFGIVGPDGAGKTTLLRSLMGLLTFDAERVEVLGHRLPQDARPLKAEVGYVPQIWGLYSDMSITENLQFFATIRGISRDEFNVRKTALLEATALSPFADRLAGQLSGGMKQKLAIACALLHHPRLLILDEPNNGVDVAARHEVWAILTQSPETFVIISTNYVEEAERCDELIYLMNGRIVTRGTPAAILRDHAAHVTEYRIHGHDLSRLAVNLAGEPWLRASTFLGNGVAIELAEDLPPDEVERRVRAQPEGGDRVSLIERKAPDMNTALRALTREAPGDA
ncbi:MAG: ABC transporter ATP-binding protein [Myxococcota bacterium]